MRFLLLLTFVSVCKGPTVLETSKDLLGPDSGPAILNKSEDLPAPDTDLGVRITTKDLSGPDSGLAIRDISEDTPGPNPGPAIRDISTDLPRPDPGLAIRDISVDTPGPNPGPAIRDISKDLPGPDPGLDLHDTTKNLPRPDLGQAVLDTVQGLPRRELGRAVLDANQDLPEPNPGLTNMTKDLPRPELWVLTAMHPPVLEVEWRPVKQSDPNEPILGYKVQILAVLPVKVYQNVERDGKGILIEEAITPEFADAQITIPEENAIVIVVDGILSLKAKVPNPHLNVVYEVRVRAYSARRDGPLSTHMRVQLKKNDELDYEITTTPWDDGGGDFVY